MSANLSLEKQAFHQLFAEKKAKWLMSIK